MRGVWQILQQNLALSTNLDPETKKKGNKNKRTNKGGGSIGFFSLPLLRRIRGCTYFGCIFVGGCGRAVWISRIEAGPVHVTMTNLSLIQHFLPAVHLIVYFL